MADQQDNVRDPNARDQDAGNVAGGSAAAGDKGVISGAALTVSPGGAALLVTATF